MKLRNLCILIISLVTPYLVNAGQLVFHQEIKWTSFQEIQINENTTVKRMYFEGAFFDDYSPTTPSYRQKMQLDGDISRVSGQLSAAVFMPMSNEELMTIDRNFAF